MNLKEFTIRYQRLYDIYKTADQLNEAILQLTGQPRTISYYPLAPDTLEPGRSIDEFIPHFIEANETSVNEFYKLTEEKNYNNLIDDLNTMIKVVSEASNSTPWIEIRDTLKSYTDYKNSEKYKLYAKRVYMDNVDKLRDVIAILISNLVNDDIFRYNETFTDKFRLDVIITNVKDRLPLDHSIEPLIKSLKHPVVDDFLNLKELLTSKSALETLGLIFNKLAPSKETIESFQWLKEWSEQHLLQEENEN